MTKSSTTGAHLLISKTNRITKPSRMTRTLTNGDSRKEKSSLFQCQYKAWAKRDQQILLSIREIANNSRHFISREFDRFTSGVQAYNFLLSKMSPSTADPTATTVLEELMNDLSVRDQILLSVLALELHVDKDQRCAISIARIVRGFLIFKKISVT